jgi:hypothetical protein
MKKLAAFLWLASLGIIAQTPQPRTPSNHQSPINELLAKPMDWHEHRARMFENSQVTMIFTLTTSWIPGPDHKGMFRYKMSAAPEVPATLNERAKYPELSGHEGVEQFIRRVNQCLISLVLYDPDGFILRKVPIEFSYGADENAHIVALTANDAVQMDVEEYNKFVWDPKGSGTYTIDWSCPESNQ